MTDIAPAAPAPPPPAHGHPAGATEVLVPLSLQVHPVARLLLFELRDDPLYTGVEVQWIDDPQGAGQGVVVLAALPDGRVDVYFDPALALDPNGYRIGAGLAGWCPTPMQEDRFEITEQGAQLDVRFRAFDGREVEAHVHERRRSATRMQLLAPMGHALREPRFLPFFWLEDFTFLHPRRTRIDVRLGGRRRRPVWVGAPWRLPRCCGAPLTAALNPAVDGPVPVLAAAGSGVRRLAGTLVELVEEPEGAAISRVAAAHGGGRLAVTFDPPLPDLARLPQGLQPLGEVAVTVDGVEQIGGHYRLRRLGDEVHLRLAIDRPWRPQVASRWQRRLFGLLRVMRTWPTTYRWDAAIDLGSTPPMMRSRWVRTR